MELRESISLKLTSVDGWTGSKELHTAQGSEESVDVKVDMRSLTISMQRFSSDNVQISVLNCTVSQEVVPLEHHKYTDWNSSLFLQMFLLDSEVM